MLLLLRRHLLQPQPSSALAVDGRTSIESHTEDGVRSLEFCHCGMKHLRSPYSSSSRRILKANAVHRATSNTYTRGVEQEDHHEFGVYTFDWTSHT